MFMLVALGILACSYVGQNKLLSDGSRTGFFVVMGIMLVLWCLMEFLG